MSELTVDSASWASLCNADGEFGIAARYWNGGLVLAIGDQRLSLVARDGQVYAGQPERNAIVISGPVDVWEPLLRPVPPPLANDIAPLLGNGLDLEAEVIPFAQYYAAIARAIELLRPTSAAAGDVHEPAPAFSFDAPVGRYIHLPVDGQEYRIYFESAGEGIPILMQHTAGCHGSQFRHLFENSQITSRFRLIAYDLPFHGKSLPPEGSPWWQESYSLTGTFARALPLALAEALELHRPVFLGCSVGGVLALDLACHHPDRFRAVIAVEGVLKVAEGDPVMRACLWNPQVSNDFKARLMESLMSPTAPLAYRKETSQVYAAGWPAAFVGDLDYYEFGYDLRERAQTIDTEQVAVHILNGEYDYSGSTELGREAHEAIKGSTWCEMKGMGHFPMSEDPEKFIGYLLPVLNSISEASATQVDTI